jgi:DNA-binding CsgD family transcriptional regulator
MLGFLALSLGDAEGAALLLDPAADLLASRDPGEPSLFTFLPDAIEAAVELHRLERAELLLGRLQEPAARLGRGWALLVSARCRALIAAARGDDVAAAAAFGTAIEIHDRLPSARPFELGRILLGLGCLQRRRREKARARETLGTARRLFADTGARLWVLKAEAEAARIGGRRAVRDGLSEVESRIADQAAAGRTNKEIATALGISAKTVAWNLSKVYAKLDVASRTELAARLR